MLLALLLAAGTPEISARVPAQQIVLTLVPEEHVCAGALAPEAWRDPSNAWFFVTSPTARLDAQELASGVLASLIDLRVVRGALHLFVIGSPIRTGLQFTTAGWRPRWPFCQ
jgi:hypothetical protein